MPATIDQAFTRLLESFQPTKAVGVDAVIQYQLIGDPAAEFYATIRDAKLTLAHGRAPSAKITLTMSSADFFDMLHGKLGTMAAYTGGKMKIAGNLLFGLKLDPMFKFKD
jgi:putative sterol carrier protein